VPRVVARAQVQSAQRPRRQWFLMDLSAYFAGFVDGEGCFTVSFSPRSKLLIGWEVRPSFSVSQNADRSEVLLLMQQHFGCGTIRPDRSDKTLKYEVRSLDDLVGRVIPFFEANPLISSKQRDFERFAIVCKLVRAGAHRTHSGLREIVDLAMSMNASGKRKFAAEVIFPQELKL
jgi:LAGLIDADG endonuclease